jgi:hypothetical protein
VKNYLNIFNFIGFYIGWYICITLGNNSALAFTFVFIAAQLYLQKLCYKKFKLVKELAWLSSIVCMGVAVESSSLSLGVLGSSKELLHFGVLNVPPLWLICIWLLFAASLRTSLSWLLHHKTVFYLITAIIAPLNYIVGSKLQHEIYFGANLAKSSLFICLMWILFLLSAISIKNLFFKEIFYER